MADYEDVYAALDAALSPLGLGWSVESLMHRLKDAKAFSEEESEAGELVEIEWVTTLTMSAVLKREDYEAIADDLENGLAEYEDDADLDACVREIVDVNHNG